jgi:hypothetical protein
MVIVLWGVVIAPETIKAESLSTCVLERAGSEFSALCGPLDIAFDHVPLLTLREVKTLATGPWLDNTRAEALFAGTMEDEVHPKSGESVELEVYPGSWGVLHTDEAWFPVTNIRVSDKVLQFEIYTFYQVVPSSLDQRIVERAKTLLATNGTWNRHDNRQCPPGATSLSIYCAMEKATIEVTAGFSHARPALQVVRAIIDERSAGRRYQHLLMDYNNDPKTQLSDVQSLFGESLTRMRDEHWLEINGFVHNSNDAFQPV